jgi:hypothetical protein
LIYPIYKENKMERDDEVKCIAYNIWQSEGCPSGCDYEHWFRAESIWEEQQEKPAASSQKQQSRKTTKPRAKAATTRKKS